MNRTRGSSNHMVSACCQVVSDFKQENDERDIVILGVCMPCMEDRSWKHAAGAYEMSISQLEAHVELFFGPLTRWSTSRKSKVGPLHLYHQRSQKCTWP